MSISLIIGGINTYIAEKMAEQKIRIGITHGDVNGIGYEIIIKSLLDPRIFELCTVVVYGSAKAAGVHKRYVKDSDNFSFNVISSARDANPKRANLVDCCGDVPVKIGEMTPEAGKASVEALVAAVSDLKAGLIDVVVTAPICKENIHGNEFQFTGHTEFFAAQFGGEPLMMMVSDILKVGLETIHIPVTEVSESINESRILEHLKALKLSLVKDFSIVDPKIAVFGLNPHSGDGGLMGQEEEAVIRPALQKAQQEGILAFGPFAADGFFAAGNYTKYDAVLAMYHDQGLAPFKALSHDGVNFTAGLPIVRTSPAHGVGFDIAGRGIAEADSMRNAMYCAMDIFRSRKIYERITSHPLQKFKRDTGADVSVKDLPETEE